MTDYNPPTQIPAPGQIIQIEGEPFHRVFAHAEKHGIWWAISRDAKSDIVWPETITGWLPITHPPVKIGEEHLTIQGVAGFDGQYVRRPDCGDEYVVAKRPGTDFHECCLYSVNGDWQPKPGGDIPIHRVRVIDLGPVEQIMELSYCATAVRWQNEAPAGTRRELRPRFNQPWKHYGPGDGIPVEAILSKHWQGREVKE